MVRLTFPLIVAKILSQLLHSLGPVANAIFHFAAQLGKGAVISIRHEDGVVAEAPFATALTDDSTAYYSFK